MKQALKIKLANHSEFKQAWDALIKLGYHWGGNCTEPCTAPYLYTYDDGRILADYFDVEGADLLSLNSAYGYFNAHKHKEVTLADLKKSAFGNEEAVFIGVDAEYVYYSVDADGEAWYTKNEPHISERGDFWGKDISMKEAPNFNLHSDWTQSLIKRNNIAETLANLEVSTQ
ncbi:hypothetical protein [Acinetobacter bereziniae]|uniref:hypothetical protein n=1 Tax=Acinetobacter bereziniae TaxID=106648 RepID=UPI0015D97295|nr:hypothetical protein [Acinetobacter bereziniae]